MLKEDLIEEMSYQHATDDRYDCEYKQTMTAFWDMFDHGTSVNTLTCRCGNTFSKEDTFATLFLTFEDKFHASIGKTENHCALTDMISHYHNEEGQQTWQCGICDANDENAIRKDIVTRYPKILYIVLNRASKTMDLITTSVDFPVENFYPYKLSGKIGSTNCDVRYDLVASIYRCSETLERGHFYAVCKDDSTGVWHECDDCEISRASLQKKYKNRRTIYARYQRAIDVLVYVQQDQI
jgi:hypothetical protein